MLDDKLCFAFVEKEEISKEALSHIPKVGINPGANDWVFKPNKWNNPKEETSYKKEARCTCDASVRHVADDYRMLLERGAGSGQLGAGNGNGSLGMSSQQ